MKLAVASGKGGTGKTTVATNLAKVAGDAGCAVSYLDCDVEEPNGHLFLKPTIQRRAPINKLLPVVDLDRCTSCGRCSQACRYGAVACVGQQVLIFAELCHSCGGCLLACPVDAIREEPKPIGEMSFGTAGPVRFIEGRLTVGEVMSPPAIRAVKAAAEKVPDTFFLTKTAAEKTPDPFIVFIVIDCPPGTSCPVIAGLRGCDMVLLVTEPTPFGLHDLTLAVKMVRALKLPMAVVVNRSDIGDDRVRKYCESQNIPILAEIADDRAVAEAYSRGLMACEAVPAFADGIRALLGRIQEGATP